MAQNSSAVVIPAHVKFLHGGLAGMGATTIIQPLDLVKTRLQTQKPGQFNSTLSCIRSILKNEGPTGFYKGLSAAWLRQISYTTARLGIFTCLMDSKFAKGADNSGPSLAKKIAFGLTAGGLGSIAACPTEVALIRMSADGRLPPSQRRNYKNGIDAIIRITREEGILTCWKGCLPTVGRAMALNAAQLATYSQVKETLIEKYGFHDNFACHFSAAMCSGFLSAFVSLPIDKIKTRLQDMKPGVDGKMPYSGGIDCLRNILRNEGVLQLWKGFGIYYPRIGGHAICCFLFLEQIREFYRKNIM